MPSSTAVKVREVLQAGWYRSFPTSGYHEETFLSGGTYTNNNFGNWTWAKKSGYKFLDDNQNGVFDTEEFGLQGWTIKLWMRDTGGALVEVDSTITDALGYYEFPYIQPGVTYYVSEVIPNTLWTQTCPNSTTQGAIILSDHPELGYVYEINLDSQEHHANNNFGNWYYHDETAWAYDPDYAIEFNEIVGPNNWGWTNGPYTLAELTAGVEMELWAGVGLNDINNKGVQVGTLTARLEGNILTVRYDMFDPNKLTTVQLYIGNTPLPMKKTGKITVPVANPGQFPFKWTGAPAASYEFAIDITSDKYLKTINWSGQLYIAAHADVRMFEEIDG
jgi:hypothetical protein